MKNQHKAVSYGVGIGAVLVAASASAAAIDTTSLVSFATDAGLAVGVIGLAVLLVKYGKQVYKWLSP